MWKDSKLFLKRFGILFLFFVLVSFPCSASENVQDMSTEELWTELSLLLTEQTEDLTALQNQANSLLKTQEQQMISLNNLKTLQRQETLLQKELEIHLEQLQIETKELQTLSLNYAKEIESQQKTINLYKGLTIGTLTISIGIGVGFLLYMLLT